MEINLTEIDINISKAKNGKQTAFKYLLDAFWTDVYLFQLKRNTNEAISRGAFGAPTFFINDEMFFGNDRMNLVEFAIGQASGKILVIPGQHNS